jgi:hypothetical protein
MAGPLQSPAQARVKWCGKSAPASRRRGGWANPTRCKAKQDRLQVTRRGPGRPQRWMAAHDRIRLTGLLRKSPAHAGLFYAPNRCRLVVIGGRCVVRGDLNGTARRGRPGRSPAARHTARDVLPARLEALKRRFCPGARGAGAISRGPRIRRLFITRLRLGRGSIGHRLRRSVQLVAGDVGIAADRRQVGVSEVLGHQPRVAGGLAQPCRGGVAQRMRGHALRQPGPPGAARDDIGQDRGLEPPAREPAEDRVVRPGLAQSRQAASSRTNAGARGWRRGFPPLP